jgi:hypothetical protein
MDMFENYRNSNWFGLNDLEALLTVAHEAKAWIAAHVLLRQHGHHDIGAT